MLLSYRANVDKKNKKGRTPFQLAASKGHGEMTKLLLGHGAVPQPYIYTHVSVRYCNLKMYYRNTGCLCMAVAALSHRIYIHYLISNSQ